LLVFLAIVLLAPFYADGQAMFDRNKTPRQPRAPSWVAKRAKLPPFTPSRTPWGEPDFRGFFADNGISSDNIERIEDWLDNATPPTETFIVDPADGRIPYQPWAFAEREQHRIGLGRGWPGESGERLYADPQTFCLTTPPRMAWRGNFQILQSPGYVFINLDWGHYYRVIPTGGGQSVLPDTVKLALGQSRGRWEGNTLVVEVTNLDGKQWLDSIGNFHSGGVRMVERWTLVDANTLDYQVTIEDPAVYTRPWTMNVPIVRREPLELWEHACHEGNAHHIEGTQSIGFKWYRGPSPPASSR
jgi:hypothetical protein